MVDPNVTPTRIMFDHKPYGNPKPWDFHSVDDGGSLASCTAYIWPSSSLDSPCDSGSHCAHLERIMQLLIFDSGFVWKGYLQNRSLNTRLGQPPRCGRLQLGDSSQHRLPRDAPSRKRRSGNLEIHMKMAQEAHGRGAGSFVGRDSDAASCRQPVDPQKDAKNRRKKNPL